MPSSPIGMRDSPVTSGRRRSAAESGAPARKNAQRSSPEAIGTGSPACARRRSARARSIASPRTASTKGRSRPRPAAGSLRRTSRHPRPRPRGAPARRGRSRSSHAGQTSRSTIGQTRIDARVRGVRCSSQSTRENREHERRREVVRVRRPRKRHRAHRQRPDAPDDRPRVAANDPEHAGEPGEQERDHRLVADDRPEARKRRGERFDVLLHSLPLIVRAT